MRRLTLDEFSLLSALLDLGNAGIRWSTFADYSGFSQTDCHRILTGLLEIGLLDHPRWSYWIVTERGKIAHAIEAGRLHRLRQLRSAA
jgi:DNA-binding IclR family transcriptional regulator